MADIFDTLDASSGDIFDKIEFDHKAEYERLKNVDIAKETGVPDWGRKNPNLYATYGAVFGNPTETPVRTAISRTVRPFAEMGGMAAGSIVSAPAAVASGPLAPAVMVAGEGSGYAIGKGAADLLDQAMGLKQPLSLGEQAIETGKDVLTGGAYSMGGQIAGPVIGKGVELTGKVIKPVLGRASGAGTESITQAIKSGAETAGKDIADITSSKDVLNELNILKSSTQFDKAMRGKITGEEIVDNAKNALQTIKDNRSSAYLEKLNNIKMDKKALDSIKSELDTRMTTILDKDRFDVKPFQTNSGKIDFDFSGSTIVEHQPVVKKALEDISTWSDTTAAGLDILKKRLSTYISQVKQGTPAQALLTDLEKNLSTNLKKGVPKYAEMTKDYAEITNIIKDLESGLMLRKQGMTGRVTADQTLRRLSSSMKDNFQLRKELVETLSDKSGEELLGQIAGNRMNSLLPSGIAGSGPIILGEAALAHFISPKLWPVLLASSPRVQGEFLRLYGRGLTKVLKLPPATTRNIIYSFEQLRKQKNKENSNK